MTSISRAERTFCDALYPPLQNESTLRQEISILGAPRQFAVYCVGDELVSNRWLLLLFHACE